jgi:hypothetical protein
MARPFQRSVQRYARNSISDAPRLGERTTPKPDDGERRGEESGAERKSENRAARQDGDRDGGEQMHSEVERHRPGSAIDQCPHEDGGRERRKRDLEQPVSLRSGSRKSAQFPLPAERSTNRTRRSLLLIYRSLRAARS